MYHIKTIEQELKEFKNGISTGEKNELISREEIEYILCLSETEI